MPMATRPQTPSKILAPSKILVVDIGGTHIKVEVTGQSEERKIPSGDTMTPSKMMREIKRTVQGWSYDAVSVGYPGVVIHDRPVHEPHNLSPGWVGFDFAKAFGCPVQVVNDAAMQALGSYKGGRMLFLGLGTGLGSAMIVDGVLEPLELAHLPYKKGKTSEDYVGERGYEQLGKKSWRRHVTDVVKQLKAALGADYVVLGGGNCKLLKKLPPDTELGDNRNAFLGGARLWKGASPDAGTD